MGGIDIISAAVGAGLAGAIGFAFWLAGDRDWREALFADDEPYGDIPNVEKLAADRGLSAGRGADRATADRLEKPSRTHGAKGNSR